MTSTASPSASAPILPNFKIQTTRPLPAEERRENALLALAPPTLRQSRERRQFPQSQSGNFLGDMRFRASDDWVKIRIGRLGAADPAAVPEPTHSRFALLAPFRLQRSCRLPNELGNLYVRGSRLSEQEVLIAWLMLEAF
jgi:hypothetical protein